MLVFSTPTTQTKSRNEIYKPLDKLHCPFIELLEVIGGEFDLVWLVTWEFTREARCLRIIHTGGEREKKHLITFNKVS